MSIFGILLCVKTLKHSVNNAQKCSDHLEYSQKLSKMCKSLLTSRQNHVVIKRYTICNIIPVLVNVNRWHIIVSVSNSRINNANIQ